MPYSVSKSDQCPESKPHAVLRDDGSVAPGGCHPSREKALAHQRALMANVPDAKSQTSAETASLFEQPDCWR
jgi:hypothetical protein